MAELYHSARLRRRPLVVLNACETGGGGSGALGMARALFAAGAGHVLATLWPVEDERAAQIMLDFYTRWSIRASAEEIGQHLRQSQLRLVHEHPFFWAGYTFIRG